MPAFTWIVCRNSVDITCRTAITLSRLVSYAGSAVVMSIEHSRISNFSDSHLLYGILPCCLWSIVMAVQLVRTGSRVNIHIRQVDINKFLRFDLFMLLLSAVADLVAVTYLGEYVGFPVDDLHAYLHRINGCMYLGLTNIPWIGQRYRYSEDKHTILVSRVLCLMIWFGGVGFGIYKQLVPLDISTYFFMGQMFLMFFPALIAIIICQNGPFTAAFWSSQRKAVSINQQGQNQRRA
ncbi:uncharacterized protein LOC143288490 [Babylonia areolata]|uniref:uncharacterized protein LOC143288490 n=1 Tax=Babylonia areolata TaxID=304850 RepID=UPI003FCF99B3